MNDKLLSTKELAEYLGIAVSTIMQYRVDGMGLPIQVVSSTVEHKSVGTIEIYTQIQDKTRLETADRIATTIAG